MRKPLSRRNFLKFGGLAGLVLLGCQSIPFKMQMIKKEGTNVVAPRYFNLDEVEECNKLLMNFPNKIRGAKSIDKYLTPGAKYCMMHIRQSHLIENPSKAEFKEIEEVQENIYFILSNIVQKYNVEKIYDEGLTESFAPIKNLCANISYRINRLNESRDSNTNKMIFLDKISLGKFKEESPALYNNYLFFQKNIKYDAIYKLASEINNLEIVAADDAKALEKANYMYDRLKRFGFFRWFTERKKSFNSIRENRENIFLNIASKQENPLVVVTYGAKHAWGGKFSCGKNYSRGIDSICDNIWEWNSNNPDKKFSLIEITPFGL